MKKFKESDWKRWLFWFSLAVAVIIVYKSFGTLQEVFTWIGRLWKILIPIIIAFATAYFLCRPVNFFERQFKKIKGGEKNFFRKHARGFSIGIVYILFIGILTLLLYAIIPELINGAVSLWGNASSYFDTASAFIAKMNEEYPMLNGLDLSSSLLDWAEGQISSFDISTVTSTIESVTGVGSTLVNVILSIFISIYMISEREQIFAALRRICSLFMKEKTISAISKYMHRADDVVYTYFTAQLLDCVIVSVAAIIALAILGVPSPLVLGFIFGMMNIIPDFGPIIGGVVVVFIILVSSGFMPALWSALVLLVLQQIDANIVNPKILGNSLDMSSFWVLVSITVGGGLFGFGGMLLGVPAAAVLRMIYRDLLAIKRQKLAAAEAGESENFYIEPIDSLEEFDVPDEPDEVQESAQAAKKVRRKRTKR